MSPETKSQLPISTELEARLGASSAEERIETFLTLTPVPVLATSFGAQSAASLHLVSRLRSDIPIVYVAAPEIDPKAEAYVSELTELLKLRLHTVHLSPGEGKLAAFNRALHEIGATGWISGIRQTQSWTRASAKVIEIQDGRLKLHPILDWTNEQIAEYYTKFDLPIHPTLRHNYRGGGISRSPTAIDEAGSLESLKIPRECGLHRRFAEIERAQHNKGA